MHTLEVLILLLSISSFLVAYFMINSKFILNQKYQRTKMNPIYTNTFGLTSLFKFSSSSLLLSSLLLFQTYHSFHRHYYCYKFIVIMWGEAMIRILIIKNEKRKQISIILKFQNNEMNGKSRKWWRTVNQVSSLTAHLWSLLQIQSNSMDLLVTLRAFLAFIITLLLLCFQIVCLLSVISICS